MKNQKIGVRLEPDFFATERSNTLLATEDGAMVAWIHLGKDRHLEVSDTPGNYPRLHVALIQSTPQALRRHVNKKVKHEGWIQVKNNIP
jgi:hypothetical protein